jgi:hypothetical protein
MIVAKPELELELELELDESADAAELVPDPEPLDAELPAETVCPISSLESDAIVPATGA